MAFDAYNIRQAVTAYADGELDAEQGAAVLDYLVAHPEWMTVLRDLQRLRAAARRVVHDTTPAVPDGVRERIAALATEAAASPAGGSPQRRSVDSSSAAMTISRPPSRWPIAVAASVALVVGLIGGRMIAIAPPRVAGVDPTPPVVPVTLAAAVTRVHVDCSRFPLQGHAGAFPATGPNAGLADSVRRAFGIDAPRPDLSSLGFEYVGAGPCRLPLEGTVHLLYRTADPARRETLSVFVQADRGQIALPPRKLAAFTPATDPHPAYAWRADGAVFFLVTDASDVADKTRDLLQLALARR